MKKIILLVLVLISVLVITSCAPPGLSSNDPNDRNYFEGTDGVKIKFVPGTPPSSLSFANKAKEFPLEVRVENKGASLSRGGIYLSGYDRTIIDFDKIDEGRNFFDDCRYGFEEPDSKLGQISAIAGGILSAIPVIGNFGHGRYSAVFQCRRIGASITNTGQGLGILLDLKELDIPDINIPGIGNFDTSNVRAELGPSGFRLDVDFNDPKYDATQGFHGPLFLALLQKFDFTRNGGEEFLLAGDTPKFPGEKEAELFFQGQVLDLPPGFDKINQPIMATSCYLYTTYAAPMVCVDPQPYSQNPKVCKAKKTTYKNGQGAPLAITSVKQINRGNDMLFAINIENVGGGTIYNPFTISKCIPYNPMPAAFEDQNVVIIGNIFIGEEKNRLPCTPFQDVIYLGDGKGSFTCLYQFDETKVLSKSAYETPLVIELWYGYSESIRASMTINKWGREPFRSINDDSPPSPIT